MHNPQGQLQLAMTPRARKAVRREDSKYPHIHAKVEATPHTGCHFPRLRSHQVRHPTGHTLFPQLQATVGPQTLNDRVNAEVTENYILRSMLAPENSHRLLDPPFPPLAGRAAPASFQPHTLLLPRLPGFSVRGRLSQGQSEGKPPSQTSRLGPPKLLPSAYSDRSPSLGNWTRRGTWTGSPRALEGCVSLGLYLPPRE